MCVTRCRFRWGLYNQPYGTTAWIVLLMPYCIHGYMKVDRQKQRGRWQFSGCLLFPEIFSLFKWLSSRIRELVKESEKVQSCSLKHCRKKILFKEYFLTFKPNKAEWAGLQAYSLTLLSVLYILQMVRVFKRLWTRKNMSSLTKASCLWYQEGECVRVCLYTAIGLFGCPSFCDITKWT